MNENKINEWKKNYGKIFKTKIGGQEYIYRTFTTDECTKILLLLQESKQEEVEELTFKAILYPENIVSSDIPFSIASTLAENILASSKIFSQDSFTEFLKVKQDNLKQIAELDIFKWKLVILQVFPGYTPTDLDNLPIDKFFEVLLLAELVAGKEFINYKRINEVNDELEKTAKEIEDPTIGPSKFTSKEELESIAADQATQNLREHMRQHRNRGK